MRKQLWNLNFGNKGFLFTLDAAIAVVIVAILLAAASYYVNELNRDALANLQTVRTGSDVLTLLDNQEILQPYSFSADEIEEDLYDVLPDNYDAKIEINCKWIFWILEYERTFTLGNNDLPEDRFIASGKRFFYEQGLFEGTLGDYYCMAKYWVWLK